MERAAPSRTELHRAPHRRTDATESADGSPVGLFSKKLKLIETLLPLTKRTSSWKPYAVIPLVRICAGGVGRPTSLPRPNGPWLPILSAVRFERSRFASASRHRVNSRLAIQLNGCLSHEIL